MPPKNMISVTTKSHMPSVEASFCCASVSNCTRREGVSVEVWSANFDLLRHQTGVVVSFVRDYRSFFKVVDRRRRRGLPFESGGAPGVGRSHLAVAQGPDEVDHGNHVADGQDASARGGEDVEHLKLRRVGVVAARHPEIAQDELREEGQVEAQEDDQRGELGPSLGIHASGHLGPPEVHAAEVTHQGAAHHNVVEVGHHEVGIGDVNVDSERGHEQAGQAADGEQPDEAEAIEHRGLEGYRALIQGRSPIENLDGRRNRDEVAEEAEHHAGIQALAADEEVMAPDEEAQDRDGHAGKGHNAIAEYGLTGKRADDFADHAHGGQHHDVHGRVRVEPEEVLEEHRVAAAGGVEDAEMQHALQEEQHDSDGQNRGAEHLNQAGGVVRPDEQGHAKPGHAGSAHAVDGDDEVQTDENGREARDEDAERSSDDVTVGVRGAVRRVEGPARIHAARQHGVQAEQTADHQQIPAQQVELGERQVARADHHGEEEVSQHGWNRRDQEKEDHHHAVHGQQLDIGLRTDQIALRRQQLHANQRGVGAADKEGQGDGGEVQQADALVVLGKEPRFEAVTGV